VVVVEVNGYTIEPGADLKGANLLAAILFEASLEGADLTVANLSAANLSRAEANQSTRWPEGVDLEAVGVSDIYGNC
jgi:uncharacterized protein YjbI with pentapeptide repeats